MGKDSFIFLQMQFYFETPWRRLLCFLSSILVVSLGSGSDENQKILCEFRNQTECFCFLSSTPSSLPLTFSPSFPLEIVNPIIWRTFSFLLFPICFLLQSVNFMGMMGSNVSGLNTLKTSLCFCFPLWFHLSMLARRDNGRH